MLLIRILRKALVETILLILMYCLVCMDRLRWLVKDMNMFGMEEMISKCSCKYVC